MTFKETESVQNIIDKHAKDPLKVDDKIVCCKDRDTIVPPSTYFDNQLSISLFQNRSLSHVSFQFLPVYVYRLKWL